MKSYAPLAALTVHQPWAWAIAESLKAVENRDWRPGPAVLPIGAELAIHAGMQEPDPGDLEYVLERLPPGKLARHLPREGELVRGCVVAVARLEAVVDSPLALAPNQRPWWVGRYGWVLGQVRRLERPVPCRGAQGVWQLPGEALFSVREQVGKPAAPAPAPGLASPSSQAPWSHPGAKKEPLLKVPLDKPSEDVPF